MSEQLVSPALNELGDDERDDPPSSLMLLTRDPFMVNSLFVGYDGETYYSGMLPQPPYDHDDEVSVEGEMNADGGHLGSASDSSVKVPSAGASVSNKVFRDAMDAEQELAASVELPESPLGSAMGSIDKALSVNGLVVNDEVISSAIKDVSDHRNDLALAAGIELPASSPESISFLGGFEHSVPAVPRPAVLRPESVFSLGGYELPAPPNSRRAVLRPESISFLGGFELPAPVALRPARRSRVHSFRSPVSHSESVLACSPYGQTEVVSPIKDQSPVIDNSPIANNARLAHNEKHAATAHAYVPASPDREDEWGFSFNNYELPPDKPKRVYTGSYQGSNCDYIPWLYAADEKLEAWVAAGKPNHFDRALGNQPNANTLLPYQYLTNACPSLDKKDAAAFDDNSEHSVPPPDKMQAVYDGSVQGGQDDEYILEPATDAERLAEFAAYQESMRIAEKIRRSKRDNPGNIQWTEKYGWASDWSPPSAASLLVERKDEGMSRKLPFALHTFQHNGSRY